MTKLILYFTYGSPPSRSCLLLLKHLGIEVEVKIVDLMVGEHKTEEYLKINTVGQVPVLVDGDMVLCESRAILAYIINSRKPGSSLYPSDPKKRALVDQRLYYDATNVFENLAAFVRPIIFGDTKKVSQESIDKITKVLTALEGYLEKSSYFAGDEMTIADISIWTSVTSFYEFGWDFNKFPNLNKWISKLQSLPYFKEDQNGTKTLVEIVTNLLDGPIFQ